jgi:hypothetical protein
MNVQLDGKRIKVKENPFIYIMRWMLERGTHWINMVYTVKEVIIGKLETKQHMLIVVFVQNYVNINYCF